MGAVSHYDGSFDMHEDDFYLSYLPLAHVFERIFLICCMAYMMNYGFYQGDVMKLKEDLAELRPTIMISVPRLYNKFYDAMQGKIKELSGAKKTITEWGISTKLANLRKSAQYTHPFYDRIIFNKFKQVLGGRARVLITASAPIDKDVLEFLKVAFCCPMAEGYGQTETASPGTLTFLDDPEGGHVGGPFRSNDIKLVDVPETGYTSEDKNSKGEYQPRGEICIRGYNCFKGYFGQPERTKETLDENGWVHTGDIGTILPNGAIKIIDRLKNIFKLSQGEYIIPEKIENEC